MINFSSGGSAEAY